MGRTKTPFFVVIAGCRPGTDAVRAVVDTIEDAEASYRFFANEYAKGGKVQIVKVRTPRSHRILQSCHLAAGEWHEVNGRMQPKIEASCCGGCYEHAVIRQEIFERIANRAPAAHTPH